MKKLCLWSMFIMVSLPLFSAETLSTISFNPSRLGQYSLLKINKEAKFAGGLSINGSLNFVASHGATINVEAPAQIVKLNGVSGTHPNITINMPNTSFQQTLNNDLAYTIDSGAFNNEGELMEQVLLNGGSSLLMNTIDSGNFGDSYIQALSGANVPNQTVNITANEVFEGEKEVKVTDSFKLGTVNVAKPTEDNSTNYEYVLETLTDNQGNKFQALAAKLPISQKNCNYSQSCSTYYNDNTYSTSGSVTCNYQIDEDKECPGQDKCDKDKLWKTNCTQKTWRLSQSHTTTQPHNTQISSATCFGQGHTTPASGQNCPGNSATAGSVCSYQGGVCYVFTGFTKESDGWWYCWYDLYSCY